MPLPAEPSLESLGGSAPAALLRRYGLAIRPAFLTAAIMPVVVGTAWGQAAGGQFHALLSLLGLASTVLVHAGANVINDVGDELGGSDRVNTERIFPYTGGSRFIQNGVMSLSQMRRWGIALVAVAMALGAMLAWIAGPMVLVLGIAGIALGVAYSLPPLQLAARGVGEVAIALGFGLLPVMGAAWLQSGRFDGESLLIAIPIALWVTAILLINEVPDMRADAIAGKRTLPVRVGTGGTRVIYMALHLGALAAVVAMAAVGQLHWGVLLVPLLLFGLAVTAAGSIGLGTGPGTGPAREGLRVSIEKTLAIHAVGSLWIAGWAWVA